MPVEDVVHAHVAQRMSSFLGVLDCQRMSEGATELVQLTISETLFPELYVFN